MNTLRDRHILLGVTGGIAAYKAAELVRLLRTAGAEVQVVMTHAAGKFITPLTLQALSGRPVRDELFDPEAEAGMGHIELARWADAILVAPATADFLARLAQGRADDLLATLCLASEAPLLVAPAMNRVMWENPATQANVDLLRARDIAILGPEAGEQACGETGTGRMREPEALCADLQRLFAGNALAGLQVLVSAGPTQEPIDPVRYLGNNSSGRMGYALARAAREAGASVTLVSGPVSLEPPEGVQLIRVQTALEMRDAVLAEARQADVFIATAAVADYRVADPRSSKHKRGDGPLRLELVENPDILAEVAALPEAPFTLGFAAETDALERHAREKLVRKGVDMIAANRVGPGLGFGSEDNALEVYWQDGHQSLPRQGKDRLARALVRLLAQRLGRNPDQLCTSQLHAQD
ncbi:MAG: bifunctional phosphopantothenoylcysteine decarboxylase/phosphopantothenate--cysteine ligase CoaBC [Gammaproteobacteria bacterium]|nr:MAG: bifunctional phosphopantothenoylcysteine decarboxylase/phosphopantothenate--cysteine ligase CoaBC [Gammaproteobacteria bacterium]